MSRKNLTADLKSAVRSRALIRIERPFDPYDLLGYAVGMGRWLLLQPLNTDLMRINGYTAIRPEDVRQFARCAEENEGFLVRATRLRRLRPKAPSGISLRTTGELLQTAAQRFPLVTIHPEKSKRDRAICWIGIPERFTRRFLEMREITTAARFRKRTRRHSLATITKIDFGSGYEAALADVARERGEA